MPDAPYSPFMRTLRCALVAERVARLGAADARAATVGMAKVCLGWGGWIVRIASLGNRRDKWHRHFCRMGAARSGGDRVEMSIGFRETHLGSHLGE